MRTIKFRAWDKQNKKMLYPLQEKNGVWRTFNFYEDGFCEIVEVEHKNGLSVGDNKVVLVTDNVMQYTGLKDKNGKTELYEDDIVNYWFHDLQNNHFEKGKGIVTWGMTGWQLHIDYQLPNVDGGQLIEFWEDDELWDLEVIGNVWENPELLK